MPDHVLVNSDAPDSGEREHGPPVRPSDGRNSPWVRLRSASYHPFIYERMIAVADPAARPGDLVYVYDKSGAFFGRGLWNPRSRISLRMLAWGDEGRGDEFWRARVRQAVVLRRALGLLPGSEGAVTDACRLIHAEGDGLSGIVAERYADCLVFELFSLGMFQRIALLTDLLTAELGAPAALDRPGHADPNWRVIVRADANMERIEGFRVEHPSAADGDNGRRARRDSVVIREHGVRYRVDLAAGHKTGFFCDQRENRRAFAQNCRDARVLDLCCYTGGFALCAKLLGEAREVTAVDLDEAALAVARDNVNLNSTRVELVHADAFSYARQMIANSRQFDALVLDPPKLAASRAEVDDALRKYHDLNTLAFQLVRPEGVLLTCSCSGLVSPEMFADMVRHAARRAGRRAQILTQTGAGPDHPVMLNCAESAYLKAIWLRVL